MGIQEKNHTIQGIPFFLTNSIPLVAIRKGFKDFNDLPQGKPLFRIINYNKVLFCRREISNPLEGLDLTKAPSAELFDIFLHAFEFRPSSIAGPNAPRYEIRGNLFEDPRQIERVLAAANIKAQVFDGIPSKADNKSRLGLVLYFALKLCKEIASRSHGPSNEVSNASILRAIQG